MPRNLRQEGADAEDLAADFLIEKGFTVVTRRYVCKGGEIDIVALDGDELVFVEVKARSMDQAAPEETVGSKKLASLRKAVSAYLNTIEEPERSYRIDLVGIDLTEDGFGEIRHHEGVNFD